MLFRSAARMAGSRLSSRLICLFLVLAPAVSGCSCGPGEETNAGGGAQGGSGGTGGFGGEHPGQGGTGAPGPEGGGGQGGMIGMGGSGGSGGQAGTGGQGGSGGAPPMLGTYDLVWQHTVSGNGNTQVSCAAVDPSGDIVVGGIFSEIVHIGALTVTGQVEDAFIAKLDKDGNPLWLKVLSGPGQEHVRALAVAPDGTIYAGGDFEQTATFDGASFVSDGNTDGLLLSLTSGGALNWAKRLSDGSNGLERVTGVTTNAAGDIFFGGDVTGAVWMDGIEVFAGSADTFLSRLAPNGSLAWIKAFDGLSHSETIHVSETNGVTWVGSYVSAIDFGGGALPDPPGSSMFAASFEPADGAHRWSQSLSPNGGGLGSEPEAAIQPDGTLWMTGLFSAPMELNGTPYDPGTNTFLFHAAFDTTGSFVSADGYGDNGLEGLFTVRPGARADEVLLGWGAIGPVTWGGQTLASPSYTTYLLGVDPMGNPMKTRKLCTSAACISWEIHDYLGQGWLAVGAHGNGADFGAGPVPVSGMIAGFITMLK